MTRGPAFVPAGPPGGPIPVLLGLGANLGDPAGQIRTAVERIGGVMRVQAVSQLYRSEPVGLRDQPEFRNLVVAGSSTDPVYGLHAALQRIEREMGRVVGERNGPRTIDIDLLAYGDLVLDSPGLTVPHPRMAERTFVLVPLAEIAPAWRHPASGLTAAEMLERLAELTAIASVGSLVWADDGDPPFRASS